MRRGIRWVVALYALDSVLLLILSLASDSTTFSDVVDFVSLILEDFAEAAFLLLLLAVAAGAGIARPGLGPHRSKVIFVPLVYLVTSLAVDLAEVRNKWRRGRERERERGGRVCLFSCSPLPDPNKKKKNFKLLSIEKKIEKMNNRNTSL